MRILVAIDGSKASEFVLQEALERQWAPGTRFCFLTVIDPFFFTRAPLLFAETKVAAGKVLEEAAEKFGAAGWETEIKVALGNPRKAISRGAEQWRSDLVLVGAHGLNVLERLAVGSTVRAVLRHTKCSVEVVRAPRKENTADGHKRRILVATDGSEFAKAAVRAVASEAWPKYGNQNHLRSGVCSVAGRVPVFSTRTSGGVESTCSGRRECRCHASKGNSGDSGPEGDC